MKIGLSWLVALTAILFVNPGPAHAQAKKLRPLRIALPSHTIAGTHFYVGKSLGIYEHYGFDAQLLVLEPRAALAALTTGDLDFYTATGTSTRSALRGAPVRVLMVGLNRPDHVLVASKEITSVDQLRGKVIGGYTANATVNVLLMEMLRKKGLKTDEYKILNIGTARFGALISGTVPAAALNGLETVKALRLGYRALARAADDVELATGGLGAFVGSIQTKRDVFRAAVQATLESIRVSATQREKVLPVLMKQFSLSQEDVSFVYDIVNKGFALDGRPTPGSQKFEFDLAQKEMGLKEPPRPEQVYDFSLLDELAAGKK
jgi:ABC-type nitrate/sulfonate/bicarbonate transport system substrate-binding protein